MNLEIIKQVICNAIPSNVNISDIDIKEGNGKLTFQISWEVLKATGPDLAFLPKIVTERNPRFGFMDGYCHQFDLNTPIPLADLEPLPSAYMEKLRAEFERSEAEANRLRVESEKRRDVKNAESIRKSEDARCLEELRLIPLCKQVIAENPTQVAYYRSGLKGNLGFLLSKLLIKDEPRRRILDIKLMSDVLEKVLSEDKQKTESLSDIAKKIKEVGKCIPSREPTVINVPSPTNSLENKGVSSRILYPDNNGPVNQEYVKALRRAGFGPAEAEAMAREKPLKVTVEGKTISQIDLKDPNWRDNVRKPYDRISVSEERVAQNSYVPAAEQAKATVKKGIFRRPEDGYTIDGYKRLRSAKNATEVVLEYTDAIKKYENRFGPEFDSRGNRVKFADVMGKRGVSACPTSKKGISDVEIMLMTNEKFTRPITDPPPKPKPVKKEEPVKKDVPLEPPPQKTRVKRILSHLNAIKSELREMLRK